MGTRGDLKKEILKSEVLIKDPGRARGKSRESIMVEEHRDLVHKIENAIVLIKTMIKAEIIEEGNLIDQMPIEIETEITVTKNQAMTTERMN